MTLRFYPEAALSKWDDIEISAVCDFGDHIERCEPEEASYWSIYLRQDIGGAACIADVPTKQLAYKMAEIFQNISENFKTEVTISIGKKVRVVEKNK